MVSAYNDRLDQPIANFRSALADRPREHKYEWIEGLRETQEDLMQALRQHVLASEDANGSLTTLANNMHGSVATIDRRVRQLRKEHVELLTSASELLKYIDQSSDNMTLDIPRIQERCSNFICKLEAHQQCECNLLSSVMSQDEPGGGD